MRIVSKTSLRLRHRLAQLLVRLAALVAGGCAVFDLHDSHRARTNEAARCAPNETARQGFCWPNVGAHRPAIRMIDDDAGAPPSPSYDGGTDAG